MTSGNGHTAIEGPYACPCCGYLTLPKLGDDEICPVCFWHDDGQDDPRADEVWGGPNYSLSLTQARANFARIGARRGACAPLCSPAPPRRVSLAKRRFGAEITAGSTGELPSWSDV